MPLPRPISQFNSELIGIQVFSKPGTLIDPDGQIMNFTVTNTDNGIVVIPEMEATRASVGIYDYLLTSSNTALLGNFKITWNYLISGAERFYEDHFQIVPNMPYWNTLSPAANNPERQAVVDVWGRIENGFDSTNGGPYLQELAQSSFNAYEVISRVMCTEAITYFNFEFQPFFNPPYQVGLGAQKILPYPLYGLMEWGVYTGVLRHISRSYIEQPVEENIAVGHLQRRDYRDLWRQEWMDEKAMYDKALRQFKRTQLVGSHRSMLVAGGLIPRMFINPARPHWLYSSVSNTGGF